MRWLWAWCLALAVAAGAGLAPVWAKATEAVATPAEHCRGEEQTFLTYPEWFLVHSPAELAAFLAARRAPSEFPWGGHIAQFWQGYAAVTRETQAYPFNAGYHLMVMVIGTSTTIEYALRVAYEATIGRLSEAVAGGADTAEDRLAAQVAQQYVDFIRVDPWYRFDFVAPLKRLWALEALPQASLLRRWERRFLLSTEWLLKAGYAWLIGKATGAVYDEAKPVTAVRLTAAPRALPPELDQMRAIGSNDPALVTVPRYRAFMAYAQALASQPLDFVEIAGNRGTILVSVLQPAGTVTPAGEARVVLVQPILSQSGRERALVALPASRLAERLRQWRSAGVEIEHIYDY